jgi:5'-3' exonuclease
MDCNSIIYDAVRELETNPSPQNNCSETFEESIINNVINRLNKLIRVIQPSEVLYIAFDGVAPFAKMEQQRTRRYKSSFLASLDFEQNRRLSSSEFLDKKNKNWNTSAITPGTNFMELLSTKIKYAFSENVIFDKYKIQNVVISTSSQPGEGEHKMFEYMRQRGKTRENVAVYGLDSDLIMLSVFHYFYCYNIYIFRESPAFSKSLLPPQLRSKDNDLLFLDIHKMSQHILDEMGCRTFSKGRIYDYIFLCFLLGNDFLPHFLSLNLRTNGIYILMDMYAKHIGPFPNRGFIDENLNIRWRWLHLFISECAKHEHKWIMEEYKGREHLGKMTFSNKTSEDREILFENIPILMRGDELYICPEETYWEERYYKIAFREERSPQFVSSLCNNYLEGLEWVFKYYTKGCPHWRWKYNYHYPPLLSDLAKYIPLHDKEYIRSDIGINTPFPKHVQLAYVIPKVQHSLLPPKIVEKLQKYNKLFPDLEDLEFKWMGCRYFWEAHAILPHIHIETLEIWEKEFIL